MKKRVFFNFVLSVMLTLFSANAVSGHEIYYQNGIGIPLKWYYVTNHVAQIRTNDDYLSSPYSSYYNTVISAWPTTGYVSAVDSVLNSSTVDLATASEAYWDNTFGEYNGLYVLGYCVPKSTDNITITNAVMADISSGYIKYASILYTPYTNCFTNTTHMKFAMVHEIGHALGLGHSNGSDYPTNAASVMRTNTVESYYLPQSHDLSDLAGKYGS